MLILRLQRMGKIKQPSYRLIVSDKRHDTQYGALENLGFYNPTTKPKVVQFKVDRIKYWLSVGAQMSETVNNLLIENKMIEGKKKKVVSITGRRKIKMDKKKAAAAPKV